MQTDPGAAGDGGARHDVADATSDSERARRAYIDGLIARGEAAAADESGELPPGATHALVKRAPGAPPDVTRRRFSAR